MDRYAAAVCSWLLAASLALPSSHGVWALEARRAGVASSLATDGESTQVARCCVARVPAWARHASRTGGADRRAADGVRPRRASRCDCIVGVRAVRAGGAGLAGRAVPCGDKAEWACGTRRLPRTGVRRSRAAVGCSLRGGALRPGRASRAGCGVAGTPVAGCARDGSCVCTQAGGARRAHCTACVRPKRVGPRGTLRR